MSTLSRRELLAAALGAPFAALACRRPTTQLLPPGEIVGQSLRLGHSIRALSPSPSGRGARGEGPSREIPVAIVGGGIAGLSAAWRLLRRGFKDFELFELEREPGGTSMSGSSPIGPFPWGAHYVPIPMKENVDLIALLNELGVVEKIDADGEVVIAEEFLCRDPEERVFFRGRWYEGLYLHAGASAEDLRQLEVFKRDMGRWSDWRDAKGRRAFAIPIAHGSDDAEVLALDSITMRDYLDRLGLTSPRLRWLVDYACRDDYGSRLHQTSAWAGVFYYASRLQNGAAEEQALITWPEGNGRIVSHLREAIGKRLNSGAAVIDIAEDGDGARVVIADATGRLETIRARRVIFTAPHFVAKHVIAKWREQPPEHLSKFDYVPWVVANITLRDRPQSNGFESAWDNILYESPSLGYIDAMHQRSLHHGPTVLTYYYPLTGDDLAKDRAALLGASRDEWADIALTDLARAHQNIRDLATRLDVMKWGHAMVRPSPMLRKNGALAAAAKPAGPIHFANTDLSGVALMEEAFHHGLRAADEVLAVMKTSGRSTSRAL